jgi:molybdate transport system substrate-binding protein
MIVSLYAMIMARTMHNRGVVAGFLALLSVAAAGGVWSLTERGPENGRLAAASGDLLLLAAASTHEAASEIADAYHAETGIVVKVSTAGSNGLARQILAGAPGQVFLSANAVWVDEVRRRGHVVESRSLLTNRLVIVVPKGNPGDVHAPRDLPSDKVTHVALAGENVPAGIYAAEALRAAEVYDSLVARKRIARGQDVRLALKYVEAGEAQAGVVYATDARACDKVQTVYEFDARSHDTIVYPVALLDTSHDNPEARHFYDFLAGPRASAIFEKHGFVPVRP